MDADASDAKDIDNTQLLLRRITTLLHTAPQPDGSRILTGFAFRERKHEFSMYVAAETTHEKILSCGYEGQEIVELSAGAVRSLGYEIIREPDDCDASHVYARARHRKSNSQIAVDCKKLAETVNCRRTAAE